jgi:2-polyprenyl-6-methoxyphenol hydroxylase-like FAD-dependent oxidoreductase
LGGVLDRRGPRLLANYGYIETEQAADWLIPELHGNAEGWDWMAQVLPGLVAWTRLSFNHGQSEAPARLAGLPDAHSMGMGSASADVTWRIASTIAGPGYFLAGDAAVVLDPTSSHGVLRALMSGMLVAHLVAKVCHDGLPEETAATVYSSWVREWFEHDAESLGGFYGQLHLRLNHSPVADKHEPHLTVKR